MSKQSSTRLSKIKKERKQSVERDQRHAPRHEPPPKPEFNDELPDLFLLPHTTLGRFFWSIALLCLLLWLRKELTPALLSFMTAFDSDGEEEECHFLFVMFLWLTARCFLLPENPESNRDELKELFLGYLELTLALVFVTLNYLWKNQYCWLVCYFIYAVVVAINRFAKHLKLTTVIFVIVYASQNFLVNVLDYFVFHDGNRGDLFGYKVFNIVSTFLVSWVYAQCMQPTLDIVRTHASPVLRNAFVLMDISNVLLMISLVYEVTALP